jgi:hypothetical protein
MMFARRDPVLSALFASAIAMSFAFAAEIVNTGTAPRHGMTSCPVNQFVVGVNAGSNTLLCDTRPGNGYTEAIETVEGTFHDQGMRACPDGTAMTGMHAGNNQLDCAPVALGARVIDFNTSRSQMHACPTGTTAVGVHVKNNYLLCADPPTATQRREFKSAGYQRHGMLSCPVNTVAVGIHVGDNVLLCSTGYGVYEETAEVANSSGAGSAQPPDTKFPGIHACRAGYAITGVNVDDNVFMCVAATAIPAGQSRMIDTSTSRSGMHACRDGSPMSGLDVAGNRLVCGLN